MNAIPHAPVVRATLTDLLREPGKAELIGGRIVRHMATGYLPTSSPAASTALADYADTAGRGVAYSDGVGYAVPELQSGRESFSPDASYYTGPRND